MKLVLTFQLISPMNTDHEIFISDTKIAKYFGVSMLLHYQICICVLGHSKFDMDRKN